MKRRLKVMTVFGTRPEAIKMVPVIAALKADTQSFHTKVVVTGQHRHMLDQVLTTFQLKPDCDFAVMQPGQDLSSLTALILQGMQRTFQTERPDIVLVQGDTTTTFAASLAAFYEKIAIGHIEAGLRTDRKYAPFPEEMNRQMTSVLADIHFAPTKRAAAHLVVGNRRDDSIVVTGNTAIDTLKLTVRGDYTHPLLQKIGDNRFLLLTVHRRENIGEPLQRIFRAMKEIVMIDRHVHVVCPLHLNPLVRKQADAMLGGHERIHLIEPLSVRDFHNFMAKAYAILTDSGGVQEEAPSLGVPVLVLRDVTERVEGVEVGALKLVGTEEARIVEMVSALLNKHAVYEKMRQVRHPYGDGTAAHRIAKALLQRYDWWI
ncbi:UDP-N-acetylglucosamine 2-epimerase (non-hydrolyzing) [Bacillus sp. FSL W7-1360]